MICILSSSVELGTHFFEKNNWSVHNVKTLHEQRTISIVTLHVTLNVIRSAQSKQRRYSLCFHSDDVKIWHFKPRSSNDVTKIKDIFYIE